MASPFDSKYNDIRNRIIYYADQWGIPRSIAIAQLWQENRFKTSGCSWANACGIAQFIPSTAAQYGVNVNDINSSLDGWGEYMAYLQTMFHGDIRLALAGYNWGQGNVQRVGGDISRMPRETRNYIATILANANKSDGSIQATGNVNPATGLIDIGDVGAVEIYDTGIDWGKYAMIGGIGLIAFVILSD